jgi:hypothetical protein
MKGGKPEETTKRRKYFEESHDTCGFSNVEMSLGILFLMESFIGKVHLASLTDSIL